MDNVKAVVIQLFSAFIFFCEGGGIRKKKTLLKLTVQCFLEKAIPKF